MIRLKRVGDLRLEDKLYSGQHGELLGEVKAIEEIDYCLRYHVTVKKDELGEQTQVIRFKSIHFDYCWVEGELYKIIKTTNTATIYELVMGEVEIGQLFRFTPSGPILKLIRLGDDFGEKMGFVYEWTTGDKKGETNYTEYRKMSPVYLYRTHK